MEFELKIVPCPLCGQSESFVEIDVPDADQHIQKYGALYEGKKISEWKVCGKCGFVHQNPRPTIESLNKFYMQSQYHAELVGNNAEEYLKFARWYYSDKVDFALRNCQLNQGRVFDIGCGQGGVLKLYEERGWESSGVEPDQKLANFAIKELALSGVKQGILDSHIKLDEKVDLIVSNHAFEHFADLVEVMQGVQNILKVGGYIFIVIPTYYKNKSSLSKQWMNSSHYSLFTHKSLNNLLSRYGFEEVVHTYTGWIKEVDDLWYLAKFTGKVSKPNVFFEKPDSVSRYLNVINPLRSFLYYPIYSYWPTRVMIGSSIINATRLFFTSPATFFRRLFMYIKHLFKA